MQRHTPVFLCLLGVSFPPQSAAAATKLACVGDSITANSGFCEALGTKLGDAYTAVNFGVSATTLLKSGDSPYWNCNKFAPSHDLLPDLVVIMLGTNDSKPQNWSHKASFVADYQALIDSYASLSSHPRVYVCLPPPAGANSYSISGVVIANEVIPLVREAALSRDVPVIDVFGAFGGSNLDSSLFGSAGDQVHPNAKGADVIRDAVFEALAASPEVVGGGAAGASANSSGGFSNGSVSSSLGSTRHAGGTLGSSSKALIGGSSSGNRSNTESGGTQNSSRWASGSGARGGQANSELGTTRASSATVEASTGGRSHTSTAGSRAALGGQTNSASGEGSPQNNVAEGCSCRSARLPHSRNDASLVPLLVLALRLRRQRTRAAPA
jgi:lysophospholipase L1-like esterase